MNIISLDYGKIYIGIALGNNKTFNYFPLSIIRNNKYKFSYLKYLIYKIFPKLIVIGFPLVKNFNSKSYIEIIFLIKSFIINIFNIFNIRIKLINEAYSSWNFIKIKNRCDDLSASYFIKIYFDFIKNFIKCREGSRIRTYDI